MSKRNRDRRAARAALCCPKCGNPIDAAALAACERERAAHAARTGRPAGVVFNNSGRCNTLFVRAADGMRELTPGELFALHYHRGDLLDAFRAAVETHGNQTFSMTSGGPGHG